MARTGQLQSDFPTAGGGSEVQLIEETFRGLAVSLEESQRARERSYVEAVGAVVTAADARDHETTGHSFRVALYAVALAKAHGLPRRAAEGDRVGRPPPRRRQDGGAGRDPAQDGAAHRRGVAHHEAAPHLGVRHAGRGELPPAGGARDHLQPPRALGRPGVSARHRRRGDPLERPHLRRGGHLRRHHLRPPLPAGPHRTRWPSTSSSGWPASSSIRRSSRPSARCPRSSCAACASCASRSTRA